jgi:ABC-2 type transport system ATP-binding protein
MEAQMLLETQGLVKEYGSFRALDGLDLQVRSGEIVGLVGPDGAGKTTTMRLLCGALSPTEGRVRVAGYDLPQEAEKARQHIGYLSQRFSLYGDLTVAENLDFFGEVFDVPDEERHRRSQELLRFAGLEAFADRPAIALSGGMQKKLGLATALVHRPQVLLLDEPTGGVDPVARQEFWMLLVGLLRAGSAVLVSTPYMDEAMRFNRVIFMDKGKALMSGKPRDLLQILDGRVLELASDQIMEARRLAESDPEVEDVRTFGDKLHLRVCPDCRTLERLPGVFETQGIHLEHLRQVAPTLEDVFIYLLEESRRDGSEIADHAPAEEEAL